MTNYYAFADSWRSIALANGIKPVTFYARIRRGMKPEEAATKPVRQHFRDWEIKRSVKEDKSGSL